jgi:hypothetical membrane protein
VPRFPARLDGQVVAGAACWVLTLVFLVGQAVAQAASKAPYSLTRSYISDLGATGCGPLTVATYHAYVCSPLHDVMNAAFVISGLLTLLGAIATRHAWPRRRLTSWGLVFLALAGAGQILVGLRPDNVDIRLHALGALFGIPGSNIGMILLGAATWRARPAIGILSGVCGIVGLIGCLLTGAGVSAGAAERLAAYPPVLWTILLGGFLLWSARARPQTTSG